MSFPLTLRAVGSILRWRAQVYVLAGFGDVPRQEEGRMPPQTYLELLFGDDVEKVNRPEG